MDTNIELKKIDLNDLLIFTIMWVIVYLMQ
jgi:hypothetical protein